MPLTAGVRTSGPEKGLDEGQANALYAFREGHSVAVVGGAGSGKSFFLKRLIQEAKLMYGGFPYVAPCALSNKAAESIKGTTIHRLFAAKPSWEFSKQILLENIRRKPGMCRQLRKIQVLIIDEISLLTSNVLDSIDFVLRELSETEWHSSLPLGGRQLVVALDPFQLEPTPEHGYVQRDSLRTCYQSRLWYLTFGPQGDGTVVVLGTNHRQSKDGDFFQILNRIRVGKQTGDDIMTLNNTSNGISMANGYTRLCLTNKQAAEINESNLALLPHAIFRSTAVDAYYCSLSGSVVRMASIERRLAGVAPQEVALKLGARVMLTRKIGDTLPGTHALVKSVIETPSTRLIGKMSHELELITFNEINRGGREQICLSTGSIKVGPIAFHVHDFEGNVIATREQLPLIPAYALTIHRSQGMTLSRVAINFEVANSWKPNGMAYVALSRCSSSSGLRVKGLTDEVITVSGRAKEFVGELKKLHKYMPWRLWGVTYLPRFEEKITSSSTDNENAETADIIYDLENVLEGEKIVLSQAGSNCPTHHQVAVYKSPGI